MSFQGRLLNQLRIFRFSQCGKYSEEGRRIIIFLDQTQAGKRMAKLEKIGASLFDSQQRSPQVWFHTTEH